MNLIRIFTLIVFISFAFGCKAQQNLKITRVNEFYSFIDFDIVANQPIIISDNINFTSLKIEINQALETPFQIGFKNPDGTDNFLMARISHRPDAGFEGTFSSSLQVFETSQTSLNLNFGNFTGHVKVILLYAPLLKTTPLQNLNKASKRCDKPEMISYVVWREFLPNPKPPREATDVEHLVVHHSAGNNADTNYVNIVRNIYLLHTQSNGWDDIGYNFLVAPNGVIFNGRDPQGAGDDDNILGAHFCGKNQNTMGVCMMGDFMSVRPTNKAIFSLKYLLAWKLKKDHRDAFGQNKHPKETGSPLNTICGHRDGCNTDCPGDSLYALLPLIKAEAARIADSCGLVLTNRVFYNPKGITVFPNPNNGFLTIYSTCSLVTPEILVYGLAGNLVLETSFVPGESFELGLPTGFYFYKIQNEKNQFFNGILIINK